MKRYIFAQWRGNKATVALIIIGFLVADIILSIGTTMSRRQLEYHQDRMIENPDDQVIINFKTGNSSRIWNELEKLREIGEIQVLNIDAITVEGKKGRKEIRPVLVWFEQKEDWHIPIIEGRYLSAEEMHDNSQSVVLGKNAAKELKVHVGDMIMVQGTEYSVIGIAGRTYRETQWDDVMYLPLEKFCQNNHTCLSKDTPVLLKSGRELFIERYGENEDIQYEDISKDMDASGLKNSIILTVILSVCVFTVAIVNITNLMLYWGLERKKTYGIIKAIGGHNVYILKMIFGEVLLLTIVSSLLALSVQQTAHLLFKSLPLELSIANVAIAILAAFITGGIAALLPAIKVIKLQPVATLNEGDM